MYAPLFRYCLWSRCVQWSWGPRDSRTDFRSNLCLCLGCELEEGRIVFSCCSLLFFRARKMGLCKRSCDLARNSGNATAAPAADLRLFWQLVDRFTAHFPLNRKRSLCLSAATPSASAQGRSRTKGLGLEEPFRDARVKWSEMEGVAWRPGMSERKHQRRS